MRQANDGPHFCDMVGLGFPASTASDTLSDGVSRPQALALGGPDLCLRGRDHRPSKQLGQLCDGRRDRPRLILGHEIARVSKLRREVRHTPQRNGWRRERCTRCRDIPRLSKAAGSGASRASRPSGQQHGSKQDRQGADTDHDQDELKERRDVYHFKSAKAPLSECAERALVALVARSALRPRPSGR
jgi:hypothetical protein